MRLNCLIIAASIAVSVISPVCNAAGYPSIDGTTSDGYTIVIEFDVSPPRAAIWKESKNRKLREESSRAFDNEPCSLEEKSDLKGRLVRTFLCANDAKSPLAGTKYISRQVNGVCEQGDPDFRYVCVSGCKQNKRAPRTMKGHWEC